MKSIIPVLLLMLLFSCNQNDTNLDNITVLPIIEFVEESNSNSYISDGSSYQDQIVIILANSETFSSEYSIEFTLRVDEENTTAIEGVDFNFTSNTYTLNSDNNFIQTIAIEILSEEIYTSITKEIALIAEVVDSDIEAHSVFTINYECFVDLTGTYIVTNTLCDGWTFEASITKGENGKWHLSRADGFWWVCTILDVINPGNIEVNCNNVAFSDDLWLNQNINQDMGTILGGTWNQQTGVLEMQHRDTFFAGGPYLFDSRYVRQ